MSLSKLKTVNTTLNTLFNGDVNNTRFEYSDEYKDKCDNAIEEIKMNMEMACAALEDEYYELIDIWSDCYELFEKLF